MTPVAGEAHLGAALAGKRVLVTGHTGFKGAWLSLWLQRLGARVVGVALPPAERSFCNAVELEGLVDSRVGDIRSAASFRHAVGGESFDLVIHMAAQALVRHSYARPLDTYQTNVMGTAVVLEEARRMRGLKGVIVVTSDKCYENNEWVWGYREHDPMGGRDPYSSSKGCAELVCSAYQASFFSDPNGPQIATVRAGNVIGGGDWAADRLMPDLMRAMETGSPARVRNPGSVRPWQHVLEPVRGYLMLAARLADGIPGFAGGWNFGCDRDAALDVASLAELVANGHDGAGPRYVVEADPKGPAESVVLRLDSTKSFVQLGWKPLLDIEQAVAMTVEWYRRSSSDPLGMRSFTEGQIASYAAAWTAAARGLSAAAPSAAATPPLRIAACA